MMIITNNYKLGDFFTAPARPTTSSQLQQLQRPQQLAEDIGRLISQLLLPGEHGSHFE